MHTRDLDPAQVGRLASVYNAQVAGHVPCCFPVTPEEIASRIGLNPDITGPGDRITAGCIAVAEERGDIIGFGHAAVGCIGGKESGLVHFLTFPPDRRAVGQAILERCEVFLALHHPGEIRAFDGLCYSFHNLSYPLLSDRMPHVLGLLCGNGYQVTWQDVFMECMLKEKAVPPCPEQGVEVRVTQLRGGRLPSVDVRAFRAGIELGECVIQSGGRFCRAAEEAGYCLVDSLEVKESERGKGWGRFLLLRAMREAYDLGFRTAALSVAQDNGPALLLYAGMGYRTAHRIASTTKRSS